MSEKKMAFTQEQKDIFDILQFKIKSPKNEVDQQISNFQSSFYQHYSLDSQNRFKIKMEQSSIKEALKEVDFHVTFCKDILEQIFTYRKQMTENILYEFFIQCFAFIVSTEKTKECVSKLFSLFPYLNEYSGYKQNQNKINKFFMYSLEELYSNNELEITININRTIIDFIKTAQNLPDSFMKHYLNYMTKCSNSRQVNIYGEILKFTSQLVHDKRSFLVYKNNSDFFALIDNSIIKLHARAIELLHNLAVVNVDHENITESFKIMGKGLCRYIKQRDNPIKTPFYRQNLKEPPELNDLGEVKYETVFKDIGKFEFDDKELDEISFNYAISINYAPKEINDFMTLISNCFNGIDKSYKTVFLKRIIKSAEKPKHISFYADYFSVVLFFISIIDDDLDNSFESFLMSPIIFYPGDFNSFDDKDDPYSYLRYAVFHLMTRNPKQRNQRIKVLLNFVSKISPFMYSLVLLFILKNINLFDDLTCFCTEKPMGAFMNAMIQLQDLYAKEPSDVCRLARIIGFKFLFKLFEKPDSFKKITSTKNFSRGIVNFIFEPSLSKLIINKISEIFVSCPFDLKNPPFFQIIPVFAKIIEDCTLKSNESSYNEVGIEIIKGLFDALNKNSNLIIAFNRCFYYILKFFKDDEKCFKKFTYCIFRFLYLSFKIIPNYQISTENFVIMVNFLNKVLVETNENSKNVINNFLILITGKSSISSNEYNFLIKYPNVIPFMLASFSKYKDFIKILSLFDSCTNSFTNCVACHDGDLDYFLIMFLEKKLEFNYHSHRIQFTFDNQKEIIEKSFDLFSKIFRVKTSAFIINQFIQTTISTGTNQEESRRNLKLLTDVISDDLNEMKPIFDIVTNKTICNIKGVTEKQLNDDFAFSFYLKIDTIQMNEIPDEIALVLLEDNDKTSYKLFLKQNILGIKLTKGNSEIYKEWPYPNLNKWLLVSMVQTKFGQDKPEFIFYIYINGYSQGQFHVTPLRFSQGKIKFTLGTSVSSSDIYSNIKVGEIGPFCLDKSCKSEKVEKDKNFEFRSDAYFSSAVLIRAQLQSDFKIVNLNYQRNESKLTNILIDYFDLNYLTFIFSKFKNDNLSNLNSVLDIILQILSSSKSAQSKYKSTLLLSHLILDLFKGNLNYDLFQKLFSTFSNITNQILPSKFFDYIIFNMNIWCYADSDSIVKIIRHLSLNTSNPFFKQFGRIERLLTIFRLAFFPGTDNKPIDENVYPFLKLHEQSKIKVIKEEFFKFIVAIGQASLNYDDIKKIYSHLFASINKSEKIYILQLLSNLNHQIKNIISMEEKNNPNIQFDLISPLFDLLNSDDIEIVFSAIMTIKNISFDHVHLYFSMISIYLINFKKCSTLFNMLVEKASTDVDLYSLVCALALLGGNNRIQKAANLLQQICDDDKTNLILDSNFMWCVWPICISFHGKESHREIVSKFLCKQIIKLPVIQSFINVYCMIGYLARHNKTVSYAVQSEFTKQVLLSIFTSKADVEIIRLDYLIISFISIFFHIHYFRNHSLYNCFLNSPFSKEFKDFLRELLQPVKEQSFDYFASSADGNENNNLESILIKKRRTSYELLNNNYIDPDNEKAFYKSAPEVLIKSTLLIDDDTHEPFRINNDSSSNYPCQCYLHLRKIFQSASSGKDDLNLIFQMRIDKNECWVDSELCQILVDYSRQYIQNNPKSNPESIEIIKKFINIVSYFSEKNQCYINENSDKNNFNKQFEESVNFLKKKVNEATYKKYRICSNNMLSLLSSAFKHADSLNEYSSSKFLGNFCQSYIDDFTYEIEKLNDERIEYKKIHHFIQKKYIRSRDSSVFLDNGNNYIDDSNSNSNVNDNSNANNENSNNNTINVNDNINTSNVNDNCNSNNENSNVNDNINNNDSKSSSETCTNISKFDVRDSYDQNPINQKEVICSMFKERNKKRKFIYKRDNCMCYGFCPIKVRPKYLNDDAEIQLIDVSEILKVVSSASPLKKEQESQSEISTNYECVIVKIDKEIPANLKILNQSIELRIKESKKVISLPNRLVRNVFRRKRFHQERAAEIVLINGKSYFIDFNTKNIVFKFLDSISKSQANFQHVKTIILKTPMDFMRDCQNLTISWENGIISNFSYLLTLNMISGRSFNDATQYPIFPLIIEDFECSENSEDSDKVKIRNFQTNLRGSQIDPDKLKEMSSIDIEIESMFNPAPLTTDAIDRYMMRIEPFTSLHLQNQHEFTEESIFTDYKSIVKDKNELIPEFFYFPEILMNLNNLPVNQFTYPQMQTEMRNAFEFVYQHRKLLESKKISKKLNNWIDMTWGIRQEDFNYHLDTFEKVWATKSSSLVTSEERIISMMKIYGEMPPQLFENPHIERRENPSLANLLLQTSNQMNTVNNHVNLHFRTKTETSSLLEKHSGLPHQRQKRQMSLSIPDPDPFSAIENLSLSSSNLSSSSMFSLPILDDQLNEGVVNKKEVIKCHLENSSMINLSCPFPNDSFFYVDIEGNTFVVYVTMSKMNHIEVEKQNLFETVKKDLKFANNLTQTEFGFVLSSSKNDKIWIYEKGLLSSLSNMSQDNNRIISSQNYFVVQQNKTILTIFDTIFDTNCPDHNGQIVSVESKIIDCQIDQSFGIIAFLSANGVLNLHSIANLSKLNAVDLSSFHPKKICITSKWGFILVDCVNWILIFDINGFLIKKIRFDFIINYWRSIRSYKDFDYIVFESDKGEIGVFEAFDPSPTLEILSKVSSPVAAIDFFRDQNCLAILTKQGELTIVSNFFSL